MTSSWAPGEEEYSSRPYVKPERRTFRLPDARPNHPTSSIRDDLNSSWKKYEGYLEDETSALGSVQQLLDKLLWKYASVLTAQPFEVAKVLLQVKLGDDPGNLAAIEAATPLTERPDSPDYEQEDSDSDGEPAYFSSNFPSTPSASHRQTPTRTRRPSTPATPSPPPRTPSHQLQISNTNSVLDVIARNWSKEGVWGTWKATNASFLYSVLQSLLENWSRSALAALLSVPDIGVEEDMLDAFTRSPHPWTTLGVAAAAAVVTGLILAPLDLVRTRFLVTPAARRTRGIWSALRCFPSYLCPSTLLIPTILHSLVHPVLTVSAPIILQSKFKLDWQLTPVSFSISKFCAASAALLVRLPLETVLRRAQVSVLSTRRYLAAFDAKEASLQTVVPVGPYTGVLATMYAIAAEEGSRAVPSQSTSKRGKTVTETVYLRGQGLAGLTRGWKISFVGLVGLWSAGMLSNIEDDTF
ncbi:related to chromosome segregation protein Cse1p [Cephalotrichum gorgonifer]|uniref:Related to chromosome segregation protein Cse1p n=1 Tax=Cephalotrichum gorgonifer TaxID=2041049 RepID=A0AAE8MW77_9PEZI|nr:related to chromosome segregation protein Cse1p [Cephalotrichum gorgonifer]